jgi:glycosyltransferase involved in cell wall biosynthesis
VVDDGADPVADCVPDDPRIRYLRLDARLVLGRKRNVACAEARGEFIVNWDDDDWYPSWRVSAQIERLCQRNARVCGSSRLYYRDAQSGQAWEYRYPRHDWVAGNTLAYRRDFWQAHPFPEIQVGEDAAFVARLRGQGLVDLDDPGICVATVHAANTSRKNTRASFWTPLQDEARLALMNRIQAVATPSQSLAAPLVSCIMPTSDRRRFVPLALENFRSQTYARKELVIVDDGSDPIGDLVIGYPELRYIRVEEKLSIGAKRNLACVQSRGELIAHWDDDDWYAPDRLERQVHPIATGQADLTGLDSRYVMVLPSGDCWTVDSRLHKRMFVGNVHGGTLVYRKAIWESVARYPDVNLAEDAALLSAAQRSGARLVPVANSGSFIYVRHGRNAWRFDAGRFLDPRGWQRTDAPSGFGSMLMERYRRAAANVV